MANTLKIKRSSVEGKIPLATDLQLGELAINTYDGKLFLKRSDGLNEYIVEVGGNVGFEVKNQTGATLTKGTVVRFAGTLGNSGKLLASPFIANGTIPSEYVMGIVENDIPNGGDGFVIDHGKIRGLNTSSFAEGTILYASSTVAGGLTTVLPQAPNNKVTVAAVINSSTNNGTIEVRVTLGSKLANDETVELINLQNKDILVYSSDNSRFENKSYSSAGLQESLISGNNLKTVNGQSLLGSGNINISNFITQNEIAINQTGISTFDSFDTELYRSASYKVQVTSDLGYFLSELKVLHNDGTVQLLETNTMSSGQGLVTFSSDISSGLLNLKINTNSPDNYIVFSRELFANTGEQFVGDLMIGSSTNDLELMTDTIDLQN